MFKFNKYLAVIGFSILLAQSCSQGPLGGNLAKNNEKFDKIYGVCDNPHRHYTAAEKIICEDKERAAGADGELAESLNLTKMFFYDFFKAYPNISGSGRWCKSRSFFTLYCIQRVLMQKRRNHQISQKS